MFNEARACVNSKEHRGSAKQRSALPACQFQLAYMFKVSR